MRKLVESWRARKRALREGIWLSMCKLSWWEVNNLNKSHGNELKAHSRTYYYVRLVGHISGSRMRTLWPLSSTTKFLKFVFKSGVFCIKDLSSEDADRYDYGNISRLYPYINVQ